MDGLQFSKLASSSQMFLPGYDHIKLNAGDWNVNRCAL